MTVDQIDYSIRYHQELLEQEEEFMRMAQDQLKQHCQELNIRKKTASARQSIDYLEKHFIPATKKRIESIKRHIEVRKLQLSGMSYEQAWIITDPDGVNQQMELFQ